MKRSELKWDFPIVALALAVCVAGCRKTEEPPATSAEPVSAPAAAAEASNDPLVAEPGTRVLALNVEGMHCTGCADAIAARVGKLDGVRRVRVSFPAKTAWVMEEQTGGPGEATIVKTIEGLGYKVPPDSGTTHPAAVPATARS